MRYTSPGGQSQFPLQFPPPDRPRLSNNDKLHRQFSNVESFHQVLQVKKTYRILAGWSSKRDLSIELLSRIRTNNMQFQIVGRPLSNVGGDKWWGWKFRRPDQRWDTRRYNGANNQRKSVYQHRVERLAPPRYFMFYTQNSRNGPSSAPTFAHNARFCPSCDPMRPHIRLEIRLSSPYPILQQCSPSVRTLSWPRITLSLSFFESASIYSSPSVILSELGFNKFFW